MPLDLTSYSDIEILRVIGEECPEFVDELAQWIDKGRTDEEIVKVVAMAGGSAQMMRYGARCIRALRSLKP